MSTGGSEYWAAELALRWEPRTLATERIQQELALLCVGRTVFPTRKELEIAGLENAIRQNGGRRLLGGVRRLAARSNTMD